MFALHQQDFDSSASTMTTVSGCSYNKHKRMSVQSGDTVSCTLPSWSPESEDEWTIDVQEECAAISFYASVAQKLFPYHVVLNNNLQVVATGEQLYRIMNFTAKEQILGQTVDSLFSIRKPIETSWSWEWLTSQNEQEDFRLAPATSSKSNMLLRFRANVVHVTPDGSQIMINMVPDAFTVADLLDMDLTTQDMPAHGEYRTALQLRSRLNDVARTEASKLAAAANLCQNLSREKELLESLVPKHVAQGLRLGENVAPRQHDSVTFFFSDVVGFTDMCKQLYPWQVCGMLNRLYCVMDYLLDKFELFKVETIGDAYVCCSGIPEPDEDHAEKVANFAIAVSHCVRHVLSPVDGRPIQLRIGVHTGSAASGVVGVNNPRYCVFGDTVNVTARHESSGAAGRVHCSAVTQRILMTKYLGKFNCISRGMVEMKGKGKLRTFWLESSDANEFVNLDGMRQLEMETDDLLQLTKFESELEKETQQKTLQLAGKLGQGMMSEKQQQVMGPVLEIIRQELCSKNMTLPAISSSHSSSHQSEEAEAQAPPEDRRAAFKHSKRTKSWDADQKKIKNIEKHFGKDSLGFVYTRSGHHRLPVPLRRKSYDQINGFSASAIASSDCSVNSQSSINSQESFFNQDSLVEIVGQSMMERVAPAAKRRGRRRSCNSHSSSSQSTLPVMPPAQLFDILERALEEFDEEF